MLSECQFLCGAEDSASSLTCFCDFLNKIKNIKIITKEEYEKKFDEMVMNMIERNKNAIKIYEDNKKEV